MRSCICLGVFEQATFSWIKSSNTSYWSAFSLVDKLSIFIESVNCSSRLSGISCIFGNYVYINTYICRSRILLPVNQRNSSPGLSPLIELLPSSLRLRSFFYKYCIEILLLGELSRGEVSIPLIYLCNKRSHNTKYPMITTSNLSCNLANLFLICFWVSFACDPCALMGEISKAFGSPSIILFSLSYICNLVRLMKEY